VSAGPPTSVRGGGLLTAAVFGVAAGFLGLLGFLPLPVGPVVGALGVVGSTVLRTRPRLRPAAPLPGLAALAVLSLAAPAGPSTDLFAGATGLAFLLWLSDDPLRPTGGGRRALPTIAPAALAVGLAWGITLGLAGQPQQVGLAGGLLVAALVLLAWLFAGLSRPAATRPPRAEEGRRVRSPGVKSGRVPEGGGPP